MYEWQNMENVEAMLLVSQRDPKKFGWGYFSQDWDAGQFCWFASLEELLAYMQRVGIPYFFPEEDYQEEIKTIKDVIKEADLTKGLTDDLLLQITRLIEEMDVIDGIRNFNLQIIWWGEFSDLASGKGEFGKDLLRHFLGEDAEPGIVTEEQIPAFAEYLQYYDYYGGDEAEADDE